MPTRVSIDTRYRLKLFATVALMAAAVAARADPAPFDLAGPSLEVTVSRGMVTLPISEVPNLAPGDHVWIKAELPVTQTARYLMVVAFLAGSTNPPPPSWFFPCDTWSRECAQQGLTVTVPQGAQQVLVFLAPKTSGDFSTLVDAVRGRPGAFVRASQDLNQAGLDRSRLEAYLSAIHSLDESDQARLKEVAPLLARSLAVKVNDKCLDRIPEVQAPCLMQGGESLILDDGHSTSIVEALTSGPASDLAMQASFTPQLSYGYYSPYIASVFDIAHILGSLHTAQYQYIPALASLKGEQLALTLNAPPSFRNPKSVMTAALPAVEDAQLPPLHAVDPKDIYCARKSALVLPVEGAPLVFSTAYTHDVALSLVGVNGKSIDLPAHADPRQGGFVVDTSGLGGASLGDSVRGSIRGYWGFDLYEGPSFQLVNERPQTWNLTGGDQAALIVGRQDTIHLRAENVSCVDDVMLKDPAGKELKAEWKTVNADEIELKLPLQATQPGSLTLLVKQYGAIQPQPIQLQAYSEPGHLDGFSIHAGDSQGLLKGNRLDEVASLIMKGIEFLPDKLSTIQGNDELSMVAQDAQAALALKAGDTAKAKATLKDGRVITLTASVGPSRPIVTLIGKALQQSPSGNGSNIQLTDPDELPQGAELIFSVRTQSPSTFSRDETIEVATSDESYSAILSNSNNGITLENSNVAVASFDPEKSLGSSAFGPLKFRVVVNGAAGNWQPLATLVRLPVLKDLQCASTPDLACKLSGSSLFLVESVSSDPQFDHPVHIPEGFPGSSLPVPEPTDGRLYIKLRDNASVINQVALEMVQPQPTQEEAARADTRLAAAPTGSSPTDKSGDDEPLPASSPQVQPAPSAALAQDVPILSQEPTPATGPQGGAPSDPVSSNVPTPGH